MQEEGLGIGWEDMETYVLLCGPSEQDKVANLPCYRLLVVGDKWKKRANKRNNDEGVPFFASSQLLRAE